MTSSPQLKSRIELRNNVWDDFGRGERSLSLCEVVRVGRGTCLPFFKQGSRNSSSSGRGHQGQEGEEVHGYDRQSKIGWRRKWKGSDAALCYWPPFVPRGYLQQATGDGGQSDEQQPPASLVASIVWCWHFTRGSTNVVLGSWMIVVAPLRN